MRSILTAAGAALLALPLPALAKPAAPATPSAPVAPNAPVAPSAAADETSDPARLALAKRTVDYVFPSGTYARMMGETMDKLIDSLLDSTMQMSVKNLAGLSGLDTETMGRGSLAEIMAIYDPAHRERLRITSRTSMNEMITVMTRFEPEIREGLAAAYARRFDAGQLAELNRFFATPTGTVYAADSYIIMMSPEVMQKMQSFMPQIMEAMPVIAQKAKAATASLPKPRTYAQLSKAEREKLAKILGISTKELDEKEAATPQDVSPEEE